ncbi:MAG: arginine decarboxylase [Saprospiraceae bacterium]|nr:arginine decarboxylase [Saprospiraceae bacterium]
MRNTYLDLVDQTFYWPQDGFDLHENNLRFHGIPVYELLEHYGTPMRLTYIPKIADQIIRARAYFQEAMEKVQYKGKYHYCYCTKSSHFRHILDEVLDNHAQLETSSSFDIDLIRKLDADGEIQPGTIIVNNGFKPPEYVQKIASLVHEGKFNLIPVCDNIDEVDLFNQYFERKTDIGIRIATEEEPNFEFYTSRLGIRQSQVLEFYKEKIATNPKFNLRMLHFFIDTGIKDTIYYWSELKKGIRLYCQLKRLCPTLIDINIGGGLPIRNSLGFEYDYNYMILEIVRLIKEACTEEGIEEPNIFTEFGKFTVGESGATFFSVIGQKQQNDAELWYMVDNSLMNTLPDAWGINERFILLPVNMWDREYQRVNIGGLSCDNADYYNSEAHINQVYLPKINKGDKLYLGFFHSGAYQDALSGYGGIKHCLIPSPQHVIVDRNENGELFHWKLSDHQDADSMLKLLGY